MEKIQIHKNVQKRILNYRKDRGFTLRQLAEKIGCTPSYISQVENGLTVPSLSMVGKLAYALKIPVVDLFFEESDIGQIDEYLRKADRKIIKYPDGKVISQLLVSKVSTKKIEPLISIIKPGGRSNRQESLRHPIGTEEFVLVLKGKIDFSYGDKNIHMSEGDTLSINGSIPHSWMNNSKEKAEVLFVFSPPIW